MARIVRCKNFRPSKLKVVQEGFTLVEFIVSLFILGLLTTIVFMTIEVGRTPMAETVTNLEVQGNIRFAASFINNLLLNSNLSDIRIWKGDGDSNKLLVKNTYIYLRGDKLMVRHQYSSPKDNYLANYVTGFKASNDDGLISVTLTGGTKYKKDIVSIDIKVYLE